MMNCIRDGAVLFKFVTMSYHAADCFSCEPPKRMQTGIGAFAAVCQLVAKRTLVVESTFLHKALDSTPCSNWSFSRGLPGEASHSAFVVLLKRTRPS